MFCGNPLNRAKEHVIPQWLSKCLDIRGETVQPVRVEVSTGKLIDHRLHPLTKFVAGAVCTACNNGWMSTLEGQAKPILKNLMAQPMELRNLAPAQACLVARWTMKTGFCLNRSSTHGSFADEIARPVPDAHLQMVRLGKLPMDVLVIGGEYGPRSRSTGFNSPHGQQTYLLRLMTLHQATK